MCHGFVYLSFTKYLHNNCISTFNDTTPAPRVYKKTQFTLLKKIKSFAVFKMNEEQLVVISSDEEETQARGKCCS